MVFNIHAGHNPDGKIACGAVGLIKESTEARKVKDCLIPLLKKAGYTVYDCTVSDGISQADVLCKIVQKCNSHQSDLDVSIHFNAGRSDSKGDGHNGGTEVYIYSETSKAKPYALAVTKEIAKLGYNNRGVKVREDLYVLRKAKAPALLIECCFTDDKDDVKLYHYQTMAQAIFKGLTATL